MKFLIVTFAIAALAQLSIAGPIARYKRSEAFVETFEDKISTLKKFVARSETLFRDCLKDIPKTPAYAKYIELYEGYLKEVDELKSTPGNCYEKSVAAMDNMMKFAESHYALDPEKESPEAKEIDRIFKMNGGEQFGKDLQSYDEKFANINIKKELEELTLKDALRIRPLMLEVC